MNIVEEVEQMSLISIFFPVLNVTLFPNWMWPCIIREKGTTILLLPNAGHFLRRFSCTRCSYREYKWALRVWLQFINSKRILQWAYHTHNIFFLLWSLCSWLWRFILVNPMFFALNSVKKNKQKTKNKDPFFITCINILEEQIISLIWKKTCHYGHIIFLILLTESWSQTHNLFTFPIFFKWQQIMDWNVLRSSANSQVLLL